MFGLSTWEILIILAVALIFVGPDQLPKVARQIGKGVRQVRSAVGKVDDEMRRAVREAAAQFDDDGNPLDDDDKPATARDPHTLEPLPVPVDPSLANAVPPAPAASPVPAPGVEVVPGASAKSAPATSVAPAPSAPSAPDDEDVTSREGAVTPAVSPGPMARDWSQVGKAPVPGRVATLVGPTAAPAPEAVVTETTSSRDANTTLATPETAPRPEKPAA